MDVDIVKSRLRASTYASWLLSGGFGVLIPILAILDGKAVPPYCPPALICGLALLLLCDAVRSLMSTISPTDSQRGSDS